MGIAELNGVQLDFHKKIMPIKIENQVCNFKIRTTHGIKHYQTVLRSTGIPTLILSASRHTRDGPIAGPTIGAAQSAQLAHFF